MKLVRLVIFGVLASFVAAVPAASAAASTSAVSGSYSGPSSLNQVCADPANELGVSGTATGDIAPFGASTLAFSFCDAVASAPNSGTLSPGATASITSASGSVSGTLTGTVNALPDANGRYPYSFTLTVTSGSGAFSGATGTIALEGSFAVAASNISGTASGTVSSSPPPVVTKHFSDCRGRGWQTVTDAHGRPFRHQLSCYMFVLLSWLKAHAR
jgi:hypothetical protein